MSYPIQVTFLNLQHSDALEEAARKHAEKLRRYYNRIFRVKIAIEMPHKNHLAGNSFQVKIDIAVPGTDLRVATNADSHLEYRDAQVALRDAFVLARRRLEDYAKRKLDSVKKRVGSATVQEREESDADYESKQFEHRPYDEQDFELPPTSEEDFLQEFSQAKDSDYAGAEA